MRRIRRRRGPEGESRDRLDDDLDLGLSPVLLRRDLVKSLEDRRLYEPGAELIGRPARSLPREAGRVIVKRSLPSRGVVNQFPSHRLGFAVPPNVAICARRHERKEVLLALGHAGRGKRVSNKRRRTEWSDIDC